MDPPVYLWLSIFQIPEKIIPHDANIAIARIEQPLCREVLLETP